MGEVVALRPRDGGEWLSGRALCCSCQHEWVAVSPVGTDWLGCPECHLMKGRYFYHVEPKVGTQMWVCGCGCNVFTVSPECVYCVGCGAEQEFK